MWIMPLEGAWLKAGKTRWADGRDDLVVYAPSTYGMLRFSACTHIIAQSQLPGAFTRVIDELVGRLWLLVCGLTRNFFRTCAHPEWERLWTWVHAYNIVRTKIWPYCACQWLNQGIYHPGALNLNSYEDIKGWNAGYVSYSKCRICVVF